MRGASPPTQTAGEEAVAFRSSLPPGQYAPTEHGCAHTKLRRRAQGECGPHSWVVGAITARTRWGKKSHLGTRPSCGQCHSLCHKSGCTALVRMLPLNPRSCKKAMLRVTMAWCKQPSIARTGSAACHSLTEPPLEAAVQSRRWLVLQSHPCLSFQSLALCPSSAVSAAASHLAAENWPSPTYRALS